MRLFPQSIKYVCTFQGYFNECSFVNEKGGDTMVSSSFASIQLFKM
ncbi:hypothetical protein B4129_2041 [Bacillus safensis]|nr:hypothetical protein B4129_2041 [Bacillus safensis]